MKAFTCFYLVLSSVLAISIGPREMNAQDRILSPQPSDSEIELLRRRLEEQQAQIQQLQLTLQKQLALVEQQQRLLEALRLQISQLDSRPTALAVAKKASSTVLAPIAETAASADKPQSVENDHGKVKFSGLLQGWLASGDGGVHDTFRLRRAELKLTGEMTPQVSWTVMIDPAKALSLSDGPTVTSGASVVGDAGINQGSRILQDAFITLGYFERLHLDVGQFKVPLSLEGLQSSAMLETVERALFASDRARGGTLGDVRDIGVMLRGPLTSQVDYQFGLFNGSGEHQNDVDKNDQKAVVGRLVLRPPFLKGLQIGGSGVRGNGAGPDGPRRHRVGGELLFVHGPFTFKSELMTGKDGSLPRRGYYTHFGYRLHPKLEGVFRFDSWDPDTKLESNPANVTERDYIAGFNCLIDENRVKLQVNYLRKTFGSSIVGPRNLMLFNLQTSW